MLTRNNNLGTPESSFLLGSNEGSIHKGGKMSRKNRKHRKKHTRKMRGGNYVEMVHDNTIPVGPRGGIMQHNVVVENMPVIKPVVSQEVTPLETVQIGGSKMPEICHDIKKVNSFSDVQQFWQTVCPGAVMLYQRHLQSLENTKPKLVKKIVIGYTRAFCHEVAAFNTKTLKENDKCMSRMKKCLNDVKGLLKKVAKDALIEHEAIVIMHTENVERHRMRIVRNNKFEEKKKQFKKSLKNKLKKLRRKNKTRKMKGGYNQYLANVPYSASYEAVAGVLSPEMSALANPQLIKGTNPHGIDNYNHFTGVGSETGVYQ